MTDKECQILLDVRCHAVTGAVQNRSCYSRLTAAVNLTVSLLGCVPCPSIGLGAEKWPLALDNPVTRLQNAWVDAIGAVIQLPGELGG